MIDYRLFTNDEEVPGEGIVLKKARAKSKGGTLTDAVQPGQSVLPNARAALGQPMDYRQRAADLYSQGEDMYQKYLDKNEGAGENAMLNALAAQFAGEGFAPLQTQLLKKAAGAEDALSKKAEFLMQQAKAYETLATTADSKERERAYRAQQDAILNEIKMMNAQTARLSAGQGAAGSFTPTGFTPSGDNIVTNSKNGLSYIVKVGPDGLPVYTPHQGASVPKASWEKQIGEAGNLAGSAFNADRLIKQVEGNPGSFGLKGAAVSMLPGGLQGYGAQAVKLTPEQMAIRANVLRDAALEINNLYGAALSMGEDARAKTFIPDAKDPPETVITKLQAARDWANSKLKSMPKGVQNAAGSRAPGADTGAERDNDPFGIRSRR